MKILFDTSVLVAALVEKHPHHPRALPWLQRAHAKEFQLLVSTHTIAELYSILTTLPLRPKIAPVEAQQLIEQNVLGKALTISLTEADYVEMTSRLAGRSHSGGAIYDALIIRAAEKEAADRLLTFNLRDFRRLWPEGDRLLGEP